MGKLNVLTVPAFTDNYLWIINDGQHAVVIDPGDATPIIAALTAHKLTLVAILLTHHHADHTGGVLALLAHGKVPVYGPALEPIAGVNQPITSADSVFIRELGVTLEVLDVPGHTRGHIAYVLRTESESPWLFCGDTLFASGCGRLFEGTLAQMRTSLQCLAALPPDTLVYCAHEYTVTNCRFACAVEPNNPLVSARLVREQAKRAIGKPTIPSTIAIEKQTNPFLRVEDQALIDELLAMQRITTRDPDAAFVALRTWRNHFS